MNTRVRLRRVLLMHVLGYSVVALLLLLRALPVDWDTPTNLAYQEGWAFLIVVICTFAAIAGSAEGVLWARGARARAVVAHLFGAAFVFAGAGLYLDGPVANGDEVWTPGREHVVMSQLVWAGFWVAQTLVVAGWLWLLAHGRTRAAPTDGEAAHVCGG